MHRVGLILAVFAAPLWLGCSDDDASAAQIGEASEAFEFPAELGGSYDFEVVRAKGNEVTPDHAKFLTFEVDGDASFAAVMRMRDEGSMDPYLALYPPQERERIAASEWQQAVVPMGREDDAVIIHRASKSGVHGLLAADRDLDADASFQIDLVALDVDVPPMDLSRTNPAVRAVNATLRKHEPAVRAYIDSGALSEGDDGLLIGNAKAVPSLKERAQFNALLAEVNDLRERLFEEHVRADNDSFDDPIDADRVSQVGRTLGALWRALRASPLRD